MSRFTINGKPEGYSLVAEEQAGTNYAAWMLAKQAELDTALARAEAAESRLEATRAAANRVHAADVESLSSARTERNAALDRAELQRQYAQSLSARYESQGQRLSAATTLLERWHNRRWGVPLDNDTSAFLASDAPVTASAPDFPSTIAAVDAAVASLEALEVAIRATFAGSDFRLDAALSLLRAAQKAGV